MRLARRFLAALCVFFCINAFAGEPAADERLQAVKRMLVTMRVGEIFMDGAKKKIAESIKANPALADDYTWMLGQLTPTEAIDRIAPIYADYLTAAQAEELNAFFASPAGNKAWRMMMDRIGAGKSSLPPTLTWEERQVVDSLAANASWRALGNSMNIINSRLESMSKRWGEQLMQQRYSGAIRDLADTLEGTSARKGSDGTGASLPGNTNSANPGLIPAYLALIQDFSTRNSNVSTRLTARLKEIDLGTVLKPANLTSREGIEDGRRKLQAFETAFSKSQRELNQINDDFMASMRRLPGPDSMRETLVQRSEKGFAVNYERSLRAEENQRRMLTIMRSILGLAGERLGQIRVQDNRLIFDDVSDLRLYESLMQQLAAEVKIEAEIAQEQAKARENAVRRLREGDAAPDAADSPGPQPPAKPAQEKRAPADVRSGESSEQPGKAGLTAKQLADEIDRHIEQYTKSRRKFVTGRKAGEYQPYVTSCLERIARVANQNYPEAARGKLYGTTLVSLSILSSGRLEKVEVSRSSGHKILDDAMLDAIKLAEPFPPFPGEFAGKVDVLSITQTFSFEKSAPGDQAATP